MERKEFGDLAVEALTKLGVAPDDLEHMVNLGGSPDERVHVLLPETTQPETVAALLGVLAHTLLDVARQARQAATATDEIVDGLTKGKRRLKFSPHLRPPEDDEWPKH